MSIERALFPQYTPEQQILIDEYLLSHLDSSYGKYGYWILHRKGKCAIFSLDTGSLISIDDSQTDEKRFFGNIYIGEFYLRDHDALIHYVAIHNDIHSEDIDAIGILNEDHIDFLEKIPNKYPSHTYIIMLASKATLILSGILQRKSVQQPKKE